MGAEDKAKVASLKKTLEARRLRAEKDVVEKRVDRRRKVRQSMLEQKMESAERGFDKTLAKTLASVSLLKSSEERELEERYEARTILPQELERLLRLQIRRTDAESRKRRELSKEMRRAHRKEITMLNKFRRKTGRSGLRPDYVLPKTRYHAAAIRFEKKLQDLADDDPTGIITELLLLRLEVVSAAEHLVSRGAAFKTRIKDKVSWVLWRHSFSLCTSPTL